MRRTVLYGKVLYSKIVISFSFLLYREYALRFLTVCIIASRDRYDILWVLRPGHCRIVNTVVFKYYQGLCQTVERLQKSMYYSIIQSTVLCTALYISQFSWFFLLFMHVCCDIDLHPTKSFTVTVNINCLCLYWGTTVCCTVQCSRLYSVQCNNVLHTVWYTAQYYRTLKMLQNFQHLTYQIWNSIPTGNFRGVPTLVL